MELYFVDLLGISFCSLMFYIYLRITKQTEQQLGFIALYCFAYSALAAVSSFFIKDDSFLKELLTCSFLPHSNETQIRQKGDQPTYLYIDRRNTAIFIQVAGSFYIHHL